MITVTLRSSHAGRSDGPKVPMTGKLKTDRAALSAALRQMADQVDEGSEDTLLRTTAHVQARRED